MRVYLQLVVVVVVEMGRVWEIVPLERLHYEERMNGDQSVGVWAGEVDLI